MTAAGLLPALSGRGKLVDSDRHRANIAAHIRSTSGRTGAETGRLVSELLRRSWPGGGHDRTEPAALDWVRRWRNSRSVVSVPLCSCRTGYCKLCN